MGATANNAFGIAEASIFFTDPIYDLQLRIRPDYHIIPCDRYPNGLIIGTKRRTMPVLWLFKKPVTSSPMTYLRPCTVRDSSSITRQRINPILSILVAENGQAFCSQTI